MAMTMTQKILSYHAGLDFVEPGQLINAKLDIVLGNDITTPVAINEFKKNGFWIVGTDMDRTDYTKIDYKGKTCLIIGNEGSGMSRIVKDNCDFVATIPMNGEINSLNASVAAGIVIYEAIKGRNEL
jgi:23S rRNA (guanosine2251-2'-O)-methyltransferase